MALACHRWIAKAVIQKTASKLRLLPMYHCAQQLAGRLKNFHPRTRIEYPGKLAADIGLERLQGATAVEIGTGWVPVMPIALKLLGVRTVYSFDLTRHLQKMITMRALAKFDAGDRQVPIRVQLEDAARGDIALLDQLRVPLGEHGEKGGVPLSVVADIKLDQGPTSINRYDRERQATVAADLVGSSALGDATKKIYDLPVMKSLPKGVKVSPSGDAESLNELSQGFATAITAGLMMVYAVLVLLFGTFLQPITILFSLPLSIGGAIAALLVTGKQLTTPVWIGILMLMGIVTKNAIMLVEFAVESIREGKPRDEAIIDAGMKRARPIVMTTIAMAAGMMPSALAFGAGGEFRSPMALAVIGGLLFSTVLSLVFVPAMFMMMDDIGVLIWRFTSRFVTPNHDDDQHAAGPAGDRKPKVVLHSPAAE